MRSALVRSNLYLLRSARAHVAPAAAVATCRLVVAAPPAAATRPAPSFGPLFCGSIARGAALDTARAQPSRSFASESGTGGEKGAAPTPMQQAQAQASSSVPSASVLSASARHGAGAHKSRSTLTQAQLDEERMLEGARMAQSGTSFFRFMNPELYMDANSTNTKMVVVAVWVALGSSWYYLKRQDDAAWAEYERSEAARMEKYQGQASAARMTRPGAPAQSVRSDGDGGGATRVAPKLPAAHGPMPPRD